MNKTNLTNALFSLIFLCFFSSFLLMGQKKIDINQDGFVAEGYDVVAYFQDKVIRGKKQFTYTYMGLKLKFSSLQNLNLFKNYPDSFFPQYGGWCAYAMGKYGGKVDINPKTYEIREGKLYLFYNSWLNNTLDKWLEEGTIDLKKKADLNWKKEQYKEE